MVFERFRIGDAVVDSHTGKTETVVNATANSYEITQTKLTDAGINCTQWFTEKEAEKRFNAKK